jgi:DNA-binding NarL/FixJ family response regulator
VRPIRVLIVEADPAERAADAALVREIPGVEIVGTAGDSTRAIRQTSRRQPDVVLMDLMMPRRSGLQVGALLKRRPGPPRVVLVSLGDVPAYAEAAREFGIDAVVARGNLDRDLPDLLSRLFPGRFAARRPQSAAIVPPIVRPRPS